MYYIDEFYKIGFSGQIFRVRMVRKWQVGGYTGDSREITNPNVVLGYQKSLGGPKTRAQQFRLVFTCPLFNEGAIFRHQSFFTSSEPHQTTIIFSDSLEL